MRKFIKNHKIIITIIVTIITVTLFVFAPFSQTQRISSSGDGPKGWVKLKPTERPFSACFPNAPTLKEQTEQVPNSENTLLFHEYSNDGYSLVYVDLPKSWINWGPTIVFKGTLQKVLEHEKGTLIQKQKVQHDGFPALEYEIIRDGNTVLGRFILVNNTVYKLELASKEKSTSTAEIFFNTFHVQN